MVQATCSKSATKILSERGFTAPFLCSKCLPYRLHIDMEIKMKVRVYRNLHRNCFSIQSYIKGKGWRVTDHAEAITLSDVKFIVKESGRLRVIKERKKNVHAFVEGILIAKMDITGLAARKISYNPYKFNSFVDSQTLEPIHIARFATLALHGIYIEGYK